MTRMEKFGGTPRLHLSRYPRSVKDLLRSDAHGAPTIYVGPTCYNDAPARQLYFDNVVFDAK
jgi:hypothetical protein